MLKKWPKSALILLVGMLIATQISMAGEPETGEYVSIYPTFIVNLSTTGKPVYAQVDVELKLESPQIQSYIKYHLAAIRHELIMLFSSKNRADIKTRGGRDDVRKEALKRIQKFLKSEENFTGVEQVLFTKFVIQ